MVPWGFIASWEEGLLWGAGGWKLEGCRRDLREEEGARGVVVVCISWPGRANSGYWPEKRKGQAMDAAEQSTWIWAQQVISLFLKEKFTQKH